MFIDLLDRLRCPNPHEETWLVAAATRTESRRLLDATLGCPVCGAEFEVRHGIVEFGEATHVTAMRVSDDEAMRAAALLQVRERGLYLLDGGWGSLAASLLGLVSAEFVLIDPPAGVAPSDGINVLVGTGEGWPLADASLQGLAVERGSPVRLEGAVRLLAPHGRFVAPVAAAVPAGLAELARDDRHWVAERVPAVVTLGRADRR